MRSGQEEDSTKAFPSILTVTRHSTGTTIEILIITVVVVHHQEQEEGEEEEAEMIMAM